MIRWGQLTATGRSALVIALTYAVGIVGLSLPVTRPLFVALTPAHLVLTLVLLLHAQRPSATWLAWLIVAVGAYLVELVGVHTGRIFGVYHYGPVLGPQLYSTPLLIGANWLMLVSAASAVAASWSLSRLGRVLAVALLLVGIDYLMEPVAVVMGMWHWPGLVVPLQNYLGWFATAVLLAAVYAYRVPEPRNPLAGLLLGCQVLFFTALRLTLVPS